MTRQNPIGLRAVGRDGRHAFPTGSFVAPGRGLPLLRRNHHRLPGPPVLSARPAPAVWLTDAAAIENRFPAVGTCGVAPQAAVMASRVTVAVAHLSGHALGTRVPDPERLA